MIRLLLTTVLFGLVALLSGLDDLPSASEPVLRTFHFSVDNVRVAQGTIWVGIYQSEEDFLDREKARLVAVKVNAEGRATIEIPEMIVGREYALGLFHDVNDNGDFDTNFLGLPAEPWAFSGTLRSRFRLPRFEEVSFRFDDQEPFPALRLRTWF